MFNVDLVTAKTTLSFPYLQLPLWLFQDDAYKDLTMSSKIVFAFLLSRFRLSQNSNQKQPGTWEDNYGSLYIIYPRTDLSSDTRLTQNSICKSMKELIASNLIREERKGQGHANRIYLVNNRSLYSHEFASDKSVSDESTPEQKSLMVADEKEDLNTSLGGDIAADQSSAANKPDDSLFFTPTDYASRNAETASQETQTLPPIYINQENKKNISLNKSKSVIYDKTELDTICQRAGIHMMSDPAYSYTPAQQKLIREAIHRLYFGESLTLGKANYTQDYVRSRLHELSINLIDMALERIEQVSSTIKNKLSYAAKTLFSCILEAETVTDVQSLDIDNDVMAYLTQAGCRGDAQLWKFLEIKSIPDADRFIQCEGKEKEIEQAFFEVMKLKRNKPTVSEAYMLAYAAFHGFEADAMEELTVNVFTHYGRFTVENALKYLQEWNDASVHTRSAIQEQNNTTSSAYTTNAAISDWEKEWLSEVIRYKQAKQESEIGDQGSEEIINDVTEQKVEATTFNQESPNDVPAQETMDLCPDSTVSSASENAFPEYRCDPIKSEQIESEVTPEEPDIYSSKSDSELSAESATPVTGSIIDEVVHETGLSREVVSVLCLYLPRNTPKEAIFQMAVQWQEIDITTVSEAMRYIHQKKENEAISMQTSKVKMETTCTQLSMTA